MEERRSRALTDEDIALIGEAVARTKSISEDLHTEHHQFISEWITRMRRRGELYDKIRAQVGGWSVIVFLSGMGYAVWEWVKNHIR